MTKIESVQEFMRAILQTRASFKLAMQRSMRKNNVDITYEMLQIMSCLWKQERVNQQELADKTFKDKASLTYLINNLEKRGLVVRQEDSSDRRNKLITVTEQGRILQKKMEPLLNEIYAFVAENIDLKDVQDNIIFLQKLDYEFKSIE
ncbi:MarR family winged helix-turn-helix transcriptional regulator [Bacteroides sedimenti]|uniref:MarR family transcriptional regulator n=1 Tax=Bacteroides sedimenti TaxID=2136147 RepID=A0ABN6Z3J4_9BACE